MAEQPNISQILAALANRPTSSAVQGSGHLGAQLPPYPPPAPAQHGSYPPFPTPPQQYQTNPSPALPGGLDLSSIKAVNSGTFDLADARGRNPFKDRNGSYADSQRGADYRHNGNAYRRSRSRSRSPYRSGRDGGRGDSYNPYRDDRRADSRQGPAQMSRQRSSSLDRSYRPNSYGGTGAQEFGGQGDSGLSGRQIDENSEIININSALVGLIIGRQGENLRRVEQETKARVQFVTPPDTGTVERECRLTGSRASREHAKREIMRIIQESGKSVTSGPARSAAPNERDVGGMAKNLSAPPGTSRLSEDTTQMMVPNRTVGLIIGKGGETIRDLQLRSGCHVNILGEDKTVNGYRPVNLIGNQESAVRAKDLIMQIVDSDANGTALPVGGQNMPPSGRGGGASENDRIYVPSEAVGMIIGKGGETVKDMQNATGCKINVTPASGRDIEREIGLIGTRQAIEGAKNAIMDKVRTVQEKNRPAGSSMPPAMSMSNNASQQAHPSTEQNQGTNPDPYAEYGGYQNYVALWYSSLQANQGQANAPAPGSTG